MSSKKPPEISPGADQAFLGCQPRRKRESILP
jgi:hypothetical protein